MARSILIWLLAGLLFFSGCSDEEVQPKLTTYQQEVADYFVEVALGFEFGGASRITRKWKQEIKVFVGGTKTDELIDELTAITTELTSLSSGLQITITQDSSQSNFYIFLGRGQDFAARFPPAAEHYPNNWGLFYVVFNDSNELIRALMYVDTERANTSAARKHLLREEFTQALGLARDSNKYPNSIFYGPWTTITQYAPIDRDLIRILYHPAMPVGLDEAAVRKKIMELFSELGIA